MTDEDLQSLMAIHDPADFDRRAWRYAEHVAARYVTRLNTQDDRGLGFVVLPLIPVMAIAAALAFDEGHAVFGALFGVGAALLAVGSIALLVGGER